MRRKHLLELRSPRTICKPVSSCLHRRKSSNIRFKVARVAQSSSEQVLADNEPVIASATRLGKMVPQTGFGSIRRIEHTTYNHHVHLPGSNAWTCISPVPLNPFLCVVSYVIALLRQQRT
jgi:hypothetical protein